MKHLGILLPLKLFGTQTTFMLNERFYLLGSFIWLFFALFFGYLGP